MISPRPALAVAAALAAAGCAEDHSSEANRPPTLELVPPSVEVHEGEAVSITAKATDPDDDLLTLSADPRPGNAAFDPQTGIFVWTPSFNEGTAVPYVITFTADDLRQAVQAQATVTVFDVNRPPVLSLPGPQLVNAGVAMSFVVSATDPDVEDTVSIIATDIANLSGATFESGTFRWTPSTAGIYRVTFVATDDHQLSPPLSDTGKVTITVICTPNEVCALQEECKTGLVACQQDQAVCTAAGDAPDGTPCDGADHVCKAGACVTCHAGQSCVPTAGPCRHGRTACATGSELCEDAGSDYPDGTECGDDQVCDDGSCVDCMEGTLCTPQDACKQWILSCGAGHECLETAVNVANGTPCGQGLVCNGGSCQACAAGGGCALGNLCAQGVYSCATGTQQCADSGSDKPNGTPCGTNLVCYRSAPARSACVSCTSGAGCALAGDPCRFGRTACGTGQPVCEDAGSDKPNGTICETNKYCSAGECVECVAGGDCRENGTCRIRTISCGAGAPVCADTGTDLPNGTPCDDLDSNKYCFGGACQECLTGENCTPPSNRCRLGTTECSTGAPVCVPGEEANPLADGSSCGIGDFCLGGACTHRNFVIESGDGQTAYPDQRMAAEIVLKLTDDLGSPVANAAVQISRPPGAAFFRTTCADVETSQTGSDGRICVRLWNGRAIKSYTFTATTAYAVPLTITTKTRTPTKGMIFTLVNVFRVQASSWNIPPPGPGSFAFIGSPTDVAAASDGTIYFTDSQGGECKVRRLTPDGELYDLAGGSCSTGGDGGLAKDATLNEPSGLALDEASDVLYVGEYQGHVVRAIDLVSGKISTYAGSAICDSANADDNNNVGRISIGPDRGLYASCPYQDRIRRVDPSTKVISDWLLATGCAPAPGLAQCAGGADGCGVTWDGAGNAYVSGLLCGAYVGGNGNSNVGGLIVRPPGGSGWTHLAGHYNGVYDKNPDAATAAYFYSPPWPAIDSNSDIYVSSFQNNQIRKIAGGVMTTVTGPPHEAYCPPCADYVTAKDSYQDTVLGIAFAPGRHLVIADTYNHRIRIIW